MVLTARQCFDHAIHALGTNITGIDARSLVNQAGDYFTTMRRWNWLIRPPVTLNFLAPITFTGATWTESTKTIALAAAFTRYTFKTADRASVTAGTPAADFQAGTYEIASKTSANAIVLVNSISPTGANLTGVAGSISFPYTSDLPADFVELVAYEATALSSCFELTTLEQLLSLRSRGVPPGNITIYGAVEWVGPVSATNGAVVPRLALYGTPTSATLNALTIQYRAGWVPLTDDSSYCVLPPWCEALFIQCIRAFAKGYDEDDEEPMAIRLARVAGPLLDAATRRDGMVQPSFGPMRGGSIAEASGQYRVNSYPLGGVTLA